MQPSVLSGWTCTAPGVSALLLFGSTAPSLRAAPGDEHWAPHFGPCGVAESAMTIAAVGADLFVGGWFKAAGETPARFVARYDGARWHPLGSGLDGELNITYAQSLATDGSNVYVGGWFTNAGGLATDCVARWDGRQWHTLGEGVQGPVSALAWHNGRLYVSGVFTRAGSIPVNRLAVWDGQAWSALGNGIDDNPNLFPCANAFAFRDGEILLGGTFTSVSSVPARNVARWDGHQWLALGEGLPGTVNALASFNEDLYAGGSFTNTALGITNLARWDGAAWQPVGRGTDGGVSALMVDGTTLLVGGRFTRVDGTSANHVARWNGSDWEALGDGLGGFGIGNFSRGVYGMALTPDHGLAVAGTFNTAGARGASHVALWHEDLWSPLGGPHTHGITHFIGRLNALLPSENGLYAGGLFTEAGPTLVQHIGRWDGTSWQPLGDGVSGSPSKSVSPVVQALAQNGPGLYAGGFFTNAGGASANHIARWDGTAWHALGEGVDWRVNALAFFGGDLVVGGAFTNAGGTRAPYLARWDGGSWTSVGPALNGPVAALAVDDTQLFVGGSFTSATGLPLARIAAWNGLFWLPLGEGIAGGSNPSVFALARRGEDLIVGGRFTLAGGQTANNVARWDGNAWHPLGTGSANGTLGNVYALAFLGTNLYVGGTFTNAGGSSHLSLARWDGTVWTEWGTRFATDAGTPEVRALAPDGLDLWVGGRFNAVADKPAVGLTRWNESIDFSATGAPRLSRTTWHPGLGFSFEISGTAVARIEASTNCLEWKMLHPAAPAGTFLDPSAVAVPHRFYRAAVP